MGTVFMIPCILHEEGVAAIPAYILEAVKQCRVLFVENERTARRYLKLLSREIVIDDYEWVTIGRTAPNSLSPDPATAALFAERLRQQLTIGIISEAGCPGVADPGQELATLAQNMGAVIKPLAGPNSILLALMASGMNGQQFRFTGYLPIDGQQRVKAIKELENESAKKNCTQIFIETPYRNNQLVEALTKTCQPATRLCIAVDLTGSTESIRTKTIAGWQREKVDIHKRPAIFLLYAGT